MKRLLTPICWTFGHYRVALNVNGRYSGKEWCKRCDAEWWRGQRVRR